MFGTIKHQKKGINTKGIGLGLCISKLIVEKFNGKINFFSKYKDGTTFFYTFQVLAYDAVEHFTSQLDQKKQKISQTFNHIITANTQAPDFTH